MAWELPVMYALAITILIGQPLTSEITPSRIDGEKLVVEIALRNRGPKLLQFYKPMLGSIWVSPIGKYERIKTDFVIEPAYSGLWFAAIEPGEERRFTPRIDWDYIGKTVFRVTYTDLPAIDALAFAFKQGPILHPYSFDSSMYCLDVKADGSKMLRAARADDLAIEIPGLRSDWKVQIAPRTGRSGYKIEARNGEQYRAVRSLSNLRGMVQIFSAEDALKLAKLATEYSTYFLFDSPAYTDFAWCGGTTSVSKGGSPLFYIERNALDIRTLDICKLSEEVSEEGAYRLLRAVPIGKAQALEKYGYSSRLGAPFNPDLPPILNGTNYQSLVNYSK